MKFRHVGASPLEETADLLVVCINHGKVAGNPLFKQIDSALEGEAKAAVDAESFSGRLGTSVSMRTYDWLEARQVVFLGSGETKRKKITELRELAARAMAHARKAGAKTVVFAPPDSDLDPATAAQHCAEGAELGAYRFTKYKTRADAKKPNPVKTFAVAIEARRTASLRKAMNAAFARAEAVARAVCLARDLVNEPADFMTPTRLASEARKLGRRHKTLKVRIYSAKECAEMGMHMFLAVGKGSEQAPKLIHITYTPPKKKKGAKKIALVGKGITFDSGGYSLKPSPSMEDMKVDMAGGAAVISAMEGIASVGSDHEVHAVVAACENLISGAAYKLGDVLQSMSGTTVEINNTDAEGRLTLGDALTFARTRLEPDEMFDFATLTGACVVALGPHAAGVLSDHDPLCRAWLDAADHAGESMWRLPLDKRLRDMLKSNIADLRNTGERWGGAVTAGLFLQRFVGDIPWVHVDIAGPASASAPRPGIPRGGTGFAVATIVHYLTT